jgi:PAS domain S-box-containing protein
MKPASRISPLLYRLLVGGVGLALLIVSTFHAVPPHWAAWLITVFIAFQVNFPLNVLASEINLSQVIILEAGLFFGPAMVGWATVAGILAGYLIRDGRQNGFSLRALTAKVGKGGQRRAKAGKGGQRPPGRPAARSLDRLGSGIIKIIFTPKFWNAEPSFILGMQVLPLVAALEATALLQKAGVLSRNVDWLRGIASLPETNLAAGQIWPEIIVPVAIFAILQTAIFLGDHIIHRSQTGSGFKQDLLTFLLVGFIPLPFVIVSAIAYPSNRWGILASLLALPTILSALLYTTFKNRLVLERRLQDLSTLNNTSRALRSTLNLESLLTNIHQQVTQLLGVDSFYVALYNTAQGRLWYPLAVKYGQRQDWPPRILMPDRLTDRVIQQGKPIYVTPRNRDELALAGVPAMDDLPAWVGVPLITSERTIGCLAAFGFIPDKEFTSDDINLLTTLSGQVSVAIENTLLFEQLHRRATQLENMNRIMALVTASLDTQQVLAQVCQSAAEMAGGQRSAIYLLEKDQQRASLAYAYGFSETFTRQSSESQLFQGGRARALRTNRPALTTDLRVTTMERSLAEALRLEGIQAIGDFPLITPDGQIGILSVYFDAPHAFDPDEVDLLQTLASQAAVSVANARLYASTDKALARRADQLAILEAVGRELAAAISSPSLFETILAHALKFTQSPWGMLTLYNASSRLLEIKASRGYQISKTQLPLDGGLAADAIRLKQAINIPNTQNIAGCLDLTGGASRSQLYVPLIHEERVLGVLILESTEEAAYVESDQAFILQLATQAAVAVVNAELYSETQRRLGEQSILYRVSTRLVGNPELEDILQTAADNVGSVMQNTAAGIYLWDESTFSYIARRYITTARPACKLPAQIRDADLGSVRPALLKTGPLSLPAEKKDTGILVGGCEKCRAMVLPLVVKQQRQGMILLHMDREQEATDEVLQLLHSIAAQVSLALQNALLFHDVSQGRDQLAAVINSVGEAIVMLTNEGRILLANRPVENLTGITLEMLIGRRLIELPARALQMLGYTYAEAETLVKSLEKEQNEPFPKVTVKISDVTPEKVFERSTVPVWGQAGRAIGWMIVLRDVTEENQIAEARELITQTLVHDLRSPVSSVLGAVDILADNFPVEQRDELMDQALRVARNGTTRVLGLIETLMDIARLKSGKIELNLTWLDLHHLAANTVTELHSQASEAGISLQNEVPTELPKIRADNGKIGRVLTNLLDNALKFTPDGGQVSISAEANPAGTIAVHVRDTGPGIPEDFREKIFDRFSQVPGQSGRRRGSGLGLTFCKLAVEAHGGRIWVEPRPGGGSIFTLTLPIEGPPASR